MAEPNDNNNSNSSSANDQASGAAKYTQDDFNKAMANKQHEVERSLAAQYSGKTILDSEAYKSALAEAQKKGEERAQMNADEKAKAEWQDKQSAFAEQQAQFKAQMESFKHDQAVSQAKEALIDADLPKGLAAYVASTDAEKQADNLKNISSIFKSAVDAAVEARVAGKKTPESGNQNNQPDESGLTLPKTKEDFLALPLEEQNKLYNSDKYHDIVASKFYNIQ